MDAHSWERTQALAEVLTNTYSQLEEEKKNGKILRQLIEAARMANAAKSQVGWWEARIDKISEPQLEKFSTSMEQFYCELIKRMKR
ncbi:hypothetical protein CDL15_Pgr013475 [Punica granatum]|nr:hypothetical protein CDL15_Pgr013475 [Punica granatum]